MRGAVRPTLVLALLGELCACSPACEEVCFCDPERRQAALAALDRSIEEEGKRTCATADDCASLAIIIDDEDDAGLPPLPLGGAELPAIRADACFDTTRAVHEIIEETGGPQCAAQSVSRPEICRTGVSCVNGVCAEQCSDDEDPPGAPSPHSCAVRESAKARCPLPEESP